MPRFGGANTILMKEKELIEAINKKAPELNVTEALTVPQLKAIHDGILANESVQDLSKELAQKDEAITSLKESIKSLELQVSEKDNAIKSLEESYKELSLANEEAAAQKSVSAPTVTVDKKLYMTTGKFIQMKNAQGVMETIKAEDLVKQKALCEALIKKGSDFLVPVESVNA